MRIIENYIPSSPELTHTDLVLHYYRGFRSSVYCKGWMLSLFTTRFGSEITLATQCAVYTIWRNELENII